MKNTYIAILFCIVTLLFTSCGNQKNQPESHSPIESSVLEGVPNVFLEETASVETTIVETTQPLPSAAVEDDLSRWHTIDPFDFTPPEVMEIYNNFEIAIQLNNMPFSLSDISISNFEGEKLEYSFFLEYDDVIQTPPLTVSIYAPYKEQTDGTYFGCIQKSFELYLDQTCDDSILKDAVICSILAVSSELNYGQADEYLQEIVYGFSGVGRSNVIDLNGYKLHISKSVPFNGYIRGYPLLHVVSYDDVFIEENTDSYQTFSEESVFEAPIHLNGQVDRIVESDYYNILEVSVGEGIMGIFYSADFFAGCFEEGNVYDFYGVMAKQHDGYSACMKLDYIGKPSTLSAEIPETNRTSSDPPTETDQTTEDTLIQESSVELDTAATEQMQNSYRLNFEGVSWYEDITDIAVYSDGTCIVTLTENTKEDGQFYAAAIWGCGSSYGVKSVRVQDSSGNFQAVFEK